MNANLMTNKLSVQKKIQELDKQFDLVLIAEHFDESLVLLDDILCWPQKDLTYLKQNERTPEAKSNMTSRTRTLLKKWLWADYLLYDHFKEKLLKRFQIFPHFEEKLKSFKALNQQIHADCIILKGDNKFLKGKWPSISCEAPYPALMTQYMHNPAKVAQHKFDVTNNICNLMGCCGKL